MKTVKITNFGEELYSCREVKPAAPAVPAVVEKRILPAPEPIPREKAEPRAAVETEPEYVPEEVAPSEFEELEAEPVVVRERSSAVSGKRRGSELAVSLIELGSSGLGQARTRAECRARGGVPRKAPPSSVLPFVCALKPGGKTGGAGMAGKGKGSAPRDSYGRFKKGGRRSGGPGAKQKSGSKKRPGATSLQRRMRSLAKRRPRDRYGRFAGVSGAGGLGRFRAASLLPREIDIGMILVGNAMGITLATAAPKIIGTLVRPESANMAARLTKIGLGIAGVAGYFATRRSMTLGLAFGALPVAVEAVANWIGDTVGTAIAAAKEAEGKPSAIPEKTPEPSPAAEGARSIGQGVGQIDTEQLRELRVIADRATGVGRYGASSMRGLGDVDYMEEEIAESPDVAMPMGGSVLASRF